jgi:hypothetical protein
MKDILLMFVYYINIMLRFKQSYKHPSEGIPGKHVQDQYLTLKDICPIWCKRLELGLTKKERDTMARDSKYCLVGEAWGFTGRHAGYYLAPLIPFIGCWTCVKYGNKMGKIARRQQPVTINLHLSNLEPVIAEFLAHWNERHVDITEKLKKQSEKIKCN